MVLIKTIMACNEVLTPENNRPKNRTLSPKSFRPPVLKLLNLPPAPVLLAPSTGKKQHEKLIYKPLIQHNIVLHL